MANERALAVELFRLLDRNYSDGELRTLCFCLGIDYADISGETRQGKARELVLHLIRRDRLGDVVAQMSEDRPNLRPDLTNLHSRHLASILTRPSRAEEQQQCFDNFRACAEALPSRERLAHAWDERMHEIDYQEAKCIIDNACAYLKDSGGAALFLLRNHRVMGGEWLRRYLCDRLCVLGQFQMYPVTLAPADSLDSTNFLLQLGGQLPRPSGSHHDSVECLLNTLCEFAQSPSGVYINFQSFCADGFAGSFLHWLVDGFWRPLVRRSRNLCRPDAQPRLVLSAAVRAPLRSSVPPGLLCSGTDFQSGVAELPLRRWKQAEICDWLSRCGELEKPPFALTHAQIEETAAKIYRQNKRGEPEGTYSDIMALLDVYLKDGDRE